MKSIFDDEYTRIIRRLKNKRIKLGLTQKDLARRINSSQSYISKIEHGQVRLDIVQLQQILKALGLKLKDVVR